MIREQETTTESQAPATPVDVGASADLNSRMRVSLGVIPTLFTLGNLVAGFAAIRYATMDPTHAVALVGWTPLEFAGALIFVGMLLDAVDGTVARLTRSTSELGAYIDSLADMVTFGVAPAFLMLQIVNNYHESDGIIIGPSADAPLGKLIWGVGAVYVSCAALRLARYSLETTLELAAEESGATIEKEPSRGFKGLPTPGAAGAVASLIVLHQHLLVTRFAEDVPMSFVRGATLGITAVTLVCAIAMVTNIPYLHFTNRFLGGQRSFAYTAGLTLALLLCIWWLPEMMAIAFVVYVSSGPFRMIKDRLGGKSASMGENSG